MNNVTSFTALGGKVPRSANLGLELLGAGIFVALWQVASAMQLLGHGVIPTPMAFIMAFPVLWNRNHLLANALYSITLNLLGYVEATMIGIPLGFLIGLQPVARALMERYVLSLRYLPLSALLGPFMVVFGIGTEMKIQFLAFGLLVYVIPQVVQRIGEVEEVYLHTMKTLGATKFQTIRWIYFPAVISRVFGDLVVLSAISWTYIIIAEVVNTSDGGIGAVAYTNYRQSHVDAMYAAIAVIVLIGFSFDKIGKLLDRLLFRYKYAGKENSLRQLFGKALQFVYVPAGGNQ